MLPVVDKPVIQYVVEECVESGIEEILIVIGKGKRAIEEHFGRSAEFERELVERGKTNLSDEIRRISEMANIHYIWQNGIKGLGDAVLCGKAFCENEPFALLLGDTIVESMETEKPVLEQLLEINAEYQASVVALEEVPNEKVSRYGIAGGSEIRDGVVKINQLIEKPSIKEKPSNLAIASRYLFRPEIFSLLEETPRGKNNEVQLTDAMSSLLLISEMYGFRFEGKRHDIGNKLDFIKTNLHYALKSQDLHTEMMSFIKNNFDSIEES